MACSASDWGIAISRLLSSIKHCKLQHLLLFGMKLFENCNFEAPVLCQASGELHFAGCGSASGCWGITLVRVLLCFKQAIGDCMSRLLFCVELLGDHNLQRVLRLGIQTFRVLLCAKLLVNCN